MSNFMKYSMSLLMSILFLSPVLKAESIPAVKAAELACHRLDRLALQKKIDKSYIHNFQRLIIDNVVGDPSGVAFAVTAYQTAPTSEDTLPLSVSILLDASGMVLNYSINKGGTKGADVIWTNKDPVSLTESGLHYVIDNYKNSTDLAPFGTHLKSITLLQKSFEGVPFAELTMLNSYNSSKLILILDIDGKLLNKEILQ